MAHDGLEIARRFDVMAIPTLIVFSQGLPSKRLLGAKSKAQLVSELTEYIDQPDDDDQGEEIGSSIPEIALTLHHWTRYVLLRSGQTVPTRF